MKCIIFKTGNCSQAAISAALCTTEMLNGISYDNKYPIVDGKYQLDFKEIYETCLKANEDTLSRDQLVTFYVYADVHLPNSAETVDEEINITTGVSTTTGTVTKKDNYEVILVDNIRTMFEELSISPRVRSFVNDWHQHLDVFFMGLLEDSEIVTDDLKNSNNMQFVAFLKFFKKPGIIQTEAAEKYVTVGAAQVSLMKRLCDNYVPIVLGDFNYYRAKEYVHYRIIKDHAEGRKVAVFRDNTGETKGAKVSIMLFVFGETLPIEFAGLDFEDFNDPMVNIQCRKCDVPVSFWANVMSAATFKEAEPVVDAESK